MIATYRQAQQTFEPPAEPLRQFARPGVVCEGWYAVGAVSEFKPGAVHRISIGAREIVVYRSLAGSVHAIEPSCAHLGADLGRGCVVQQGLRCGFHCWIWGPDGRCVSGAGRLEGRRIRSYAVRERWGVVWTWAGGEPSYELPEPASENARHVLRLPSQRMDCHPHVMLGNGLDLTHVPSVHGFHMLDDPTVELDPPHRLTVGIHGRFASTWMRKLLFLAGRAARWRFTTIGPSLAWLAVESPTPFELIWAGRPLPDGSCATQTVFFLPTRLTFVRSLPMMIATTWRDRRVLQGLRFKPGFVASDAVFCLYARLIEDLPQWEST
jgi:phenylpropionate dioxygenase-like ring-hydroxylating dioxygenase large terminal subunit